jgi:hypothetical protein
MKQRSRVSVEVETGYFEGILIERWRDNSFLGVHSKDAHQQSAIIVPANDVKQLQLRVPEKQ